MKSVLKRPTVQHLFGALMLCAGLAACGASASPTSSAMPKQLLHGLIDMQDISWHDTDNATAPPFNISNVAQFPGLFGGVVVNASWNQMQPAQGGPLNTSLIDAALAAVRAYNAQNPSAPLGVKLRIYAGSNAPLWAKNLLGTPVTSYRNPGGCGGNPTGCPLTEGYFWMPQYIAYWRAFQAMVAQKYDGEPLIQAVAVTSCASQTDEPFVPSGGSQNRTNLQNAGYTDTAEKSCLLGAVDDYAAWRLTRIDYTFNTFTGLFSPSPGPDPAFTQSVINRCRSARGAQCILNNHALSAPVPAPTPTATPDPVYSMIAAAGPPINFQTQSPRGMQCLWTQTVSQGIAYGARAIELWPDATFDGFDGLQYAQVAQLRALFYVTPPPVAPTPDPNASPCPAFN